MAKKHTGHCACGAVKFAFDTDPTSIAVCHCLDCKKASDGEAAAFFGVPEDDFTLISGDPKFFHYVAQSGKGLDRNFRPDCGARLFTHNEAPTSAGGYPCAVQMAQSKTEKEQHYA
jgi:hypothetical protein